METNIVTKDWKVITKSDKTKTIAGNYDVKVGGAVLATTAFNEGYGCTDISIPAELMVEAELLDAKIRQAIINNFTK